MNIFSNINTYLAEAKGKITISNYNEADSLVFAQLSYYPFENIYSEDKSVFIPELAEKIMRQTEFVNVYSKDKQTFIKELAAGDRYRRCKIYKMRSVSTADTRWAAYTVDLGQKDTVVVAMRGTGKTTVGWAEDFRLGYSVLGTGAQLASFRYLKETEASKIYLTGHSKGGNNVSSAYAMSNPYIRDKVVRIDNFDGPGVNPEFAKNYGNGYEDLGTKLHNFYPEGSVIGLLLKDNPGETAFIKTSLRDSYRSNPLMGQHDPFSWEIKKGRLVRADQLPISGLLNYAIDELMNATNLLQRYYLVQLIENMGIPEIISGEIQNVAAIFTRVLGGLVNASREEKSALFYALLAFIKGVILQSKEWIAKLPIKEYNKIELL